MVQFPTQCGAETARGICMMSLRDGRCEVHGDPKFFVSRLQRSPEPASPERKQPADVILDHWFAKHPGQADPSWPDEIRSLLDALFVAGYVVVPADSWRLRSDFGVVPREASDGR